MDCFQDANLRQHCACWRTGNPHWVTSDHRVYPGVGVRHSSQTVWLGTGGGGEVMMDLRRSMGQREWLMGAPASQVQCTIRQCRTDCEHAKERCIATSECVFYVYAKWMDAWTSQRILFFTNVVHERKMFLIICLDFWWVNSSLTATVKSCVNIH